MADQDTNLIKDIAQHRKQALATGEHLPDQPGAGGVLTFTFTAQMDFIWVRSVGGISRADPWGGEPTGNSGWYCDDNEATPIEVQASQIKIHAPAGATVSVWGQRFPAAT